MTTTTAMKEKQKLVMQNNPRCMEGQKTEAVRRYKQKDCRLEEQPYELKTRLTKSVSSRRKASHRRQQQHITIVISSSVIGNTS